MSDTENNVPSKVEQFLMKRISNTAKEIHSLEESSTLQESNINAIIAKGGKLTAYKEMLEFIHTHPL